MSALQKKALQKKAALAFLASWKKERTDPEKRGRQ